MPVGVVERLAYQVTRGACAAVMEHMPELAAAWREAMTPTAREAVGDPVKEQAERDAEQAEIDAGTLPPADVGRAG